jgi:hypothetical protein
MNAFEKLLFSIKVVRVGSIGIDPKNGIESSLDNAFPPPVENKAEHSAQ